jgi:hypothetical protein
MQEWPYCTRIHETLLPLGSAFERLLSRSNPERQLLADSRGSAWSLKAPPWEMRGFDASGSLRASLRTHTIGQELPFDTTAPQRTFADLLNGPSYFPAQK